VNSSRSPTERRWAPDLVLGNSAQLVSPGSSSSEPARLYVGEFGHNGTLEQILTFYSTDELPDCGRDELINLIPRLGTRFATYADFGAAQVEDVVPARSSPGHRAERTCSRARWL